MIMIEIFFYISLFMLFFIYFGYLFILRISLFFKKNSINKRNIYPSVSLIINAHNEEDIIEDKLLNSLSLDYPKEKLEIIISSDGSTDRTIEIAKKYESDDIKIFDHKEHKGKVFALNKTVPKARGEIIIFTDANAIVEKNALKNIVRNFGDENVGCVCANLRYTKKDRKDGGENYYKKYENYLKKLESEIGSITAAEGSFFGIRKEVFRPIPEDCGEDAILVYYTVMQKKRAVFEENAVSTEEFFMSSTDQIKRRARIVSRNLTMLSRTKEILNPFACGFFSLKLISHKIMRWLSPFFLIMVFLLNAILIKENPVFAVLFSAQLIFYCFASLHVLFFFAIKKKILFFYIPYFFTVSNIGMFLGFYYFISRKSLVKWNVVR